MIERHIGWLNILELVRGGAPARFRISGDPWVDILVEPGNSALSLLIPVTPDLVVPPSEFRSIKIDRLNIDGETCLRVTTRSQPLFEEFYTLLTEIADSVQLEKKTPLAAIQSRLESWVALLQSISVMTPEKQLGLLGELWLLDRMIALRGGEALATWVGPLAEPHDFRLDKKEFEVKSTRNRERIHIINALDQLLPSLNHDLYILSLQFEPANGDLSLKGMVARIRNSLAQIGGVRDFDRLLEDRCGYRDDDDDHYGSSYQLRSKPLLVAVDEGCPRITRAQLRQWLGPHQEVRVSDVSYRLNLGGLGFEDGSSAFLDVLPILNTIVPRRK
jgi:hypothetical protein